MLAPPNQGSTLAARNRDLRAFRWLYGRAVDELQPERVARLPEPPDSCETLILVGGRGDDRILIELARQLEASEIARAGLI